MHKQKINYIKNEWEQVFENIDSKSIYYACGNWGNRREVATMPGATWRREIIIRSVVTGRREITTMPVVIGK